MGELEPSRMEEDPRTRSSRGRGGDPVARVADERRAEVSQVDADLVRAAGLGARLDERRARAGRIVR